MCYIKFVKKLFSGIKEFENISKAIKEGTLPNAILVVCPDSETNKQFAQEVCSSFFCAEKSACGNCEGCVKTEKETNPDLIVYPKEKAFQVADAKEIVDNAILSPMIFSEKIYLIHNIDLATVPAQNKILKVLEEPPASVKFLITCTNETKVLPTIISRCVKVNLMQLEKHRLQEFLGQEATQNFNNAYDYGEGYLGKTIFALENKQFEGLNSLAEDIIYNLKSSKEIISLSSKISKNKEQFLIILNLLQVKFRKILEIGTEGYSKLCVVCILDAILQIQKEVESNVLINLQADNLLMKILECKYLYK